MMTITATRNKLCYTGLLAYKYIPLGRLLFFFFTPTLYSLSKTPSSWYMLVARLFVQKKAISTAM